MPNKFSPAPLSGGVGSEGRGAESPVGPRPSQRLAISDPILASFRPVSSETDLARLVAAAQSDNHLPICPTHFAEQQGEVVGYASIGLVPMVFCWAHTRKVRARESFALLARVEQEAARHAPAGIICTPCTFESPFFKFMPKLGYGHCGDGGFFLKNLRK